MMYPWRKRKDGDEKLWSVGDEIIVAMRMPAYENHPSYWQIRQMVWSSYTRIGNPDAGLFFCLEDPYGEGFDWSLSEVEYWMPVSEMKACLPPVDEEAKPCCG